MSKLAKMGLSALFATLLLGGNAVLGVALVGGAQADAMLFDCTRDCQCEFEGTEGGFCSGSGYGSDCEEHSECRPN